MLFINIGIDDNLLVLKYINLLLTNNDISKLFVSNLYIIDIFCVKTVYKIGITIAKF
jgi:hypothetical protein